MFGNKKVCYDSSEKCQVQLTDEKQSPGEQALSNLLILDILFKHLDAQDIICASMVNKSLRCYSLEFLRNNSSNKKLHYPVCIQINDDNPCRALARFNTYLVENQFEINDQDKLIFDGIQQAYPGKTFKLKKCADCLINDWNQIDSIGQLAPPTIKDCYGKILEKIKFKYICFNSRIPTSCPFALFIKFIILKHDQDILELDFGDKCDENVIREFYLLTSFTEQKVFPNLEILGIDIDWNGFGIPIVSPVLKMIKRFAYDVHLNREFHQRMDFPFHVLTILNNIHLDFRAIKNFVKTVQKFRIRPQNLEIVNNHLGMHEDQFQLRQNRVYRQRLFELGQLSCSSLTKLSCPLSALTCMAGKGFLPYLDDDVECKNTFLLLKILELQGSLEVDIMDWFSWMDFQRNFPQLEQIFFTFLPPPALSGVSGPYNKYHGCVCSGIKCLTLEWKEIKIELPYGRENISRVLNLFSHIRHLELRSLTLPCHVLREAISDIVNKIENLPFLEEITLWFKSLIHFSLDELFLGKGNLSTFERKLGEDDLEHVWAYKSPVFKHKRFTRIIIEALGVACLDGDTPWSCYSDEPPDRFVVSSNTAKNICKHRPGFQIHLKTKDVCKAAYGGQCNNNVGISGLRFEHLEPYTSITTSGIQTCRKSSLRIIEFVGDNQVDEVSAYDEILGNKSNVV